MIAFLHTSLAVFRRNCFKSRLDLSIKVETQLMTEAIYSLTTENCLDFRENGLNSVCFRAVGGVKQRSNAELRPPRNQQLCFMHVKLVHEQRYRAPTVLGAQGFQITEEVFGIYRL